MLTGHVIGSIMQTLASIAILVGIALGLGFRSPSGPFQWLAASGVLALFAFALIWLAVALGLAAKSVETASNTPIAALTWSAGVAAASFIWAVRLYDGRRAAEPE